MLRRPQLPFPHVWRGTAPQNDTARFAFVDQPGSNSASHLESAVLEGLAFSCTDGVEAVAELKGTPRSIHVFGGVSNSRAWRSGLASVLDAPIVRLHVAELAATGADINTSEGPQVTNTRGGLPPNRGDGSNLKRRSGSVHQSSRFTSLKP